MDPITFYLKDVNKKSHGYRPTWLPNLPIHLGDVGVLENNVFRKKGTLKSLGIDFNSVHSDSNNSIDLSSEKGVTIITKIAGKVEPKAVSLGVADAGFIVEFNNKNSYIFKIRGSRTSIIQNLGEVEAEVLNRYESDNWDSNLVIISEIVEAKSATILLSGHAKSKIELKVEGNVKVATMDIADAGLNLKFETGQALAAKIIGEQGIMPLYRVIGVKKNIFSTTISGKAEEGEEDKEKEFEVGEIKM